MEFLALLVLSAVFTFAPGLPEGLAVEYVHDFHWRVLPVAVVCASGQCISYWVLYMFGEFLVERWTRLRVQVTKVRQRYAHHLEQRFLTVTVFSAVASTPPAVAMAPLASAFGVPLRHLMPILLAGRVVRFVVLILFWSRVLTWVHTWV